MEKEKESKSSLQLGWRDFSLSANGPLTVVVILFICLAIINSGMVIYHHWGIAELHNAMIAGLDKLTAAQNKATDVQSEGNYIHTLTKEEQQALCLEMPVSLKAKLRANGISHNIKRC